MTRSPDLPPPSRWRRPEDQAFAEISQYDPTASSPGLVAAWGRRQGLTALAARARLAARPAPRACTARDLHAGDTLDNGWRVLVVGLDHEPTGPVVTLTTSLHLSTTLGADIRTHTYPADATFAGVTCPHEENDR